MTLRGYIVGRLADTAVISIGGSLMPWVTPLPVGSIVQVTLVPGLSFGTSLPARLGRGDTNRFLLLDGPFKTVLSIPRTGAVPPRVDLQLSEIPAEISEGFESATADTSSRDIAPASPPGMSLQIPPALAGLAAQLQQSGLPIPQ